MFRTIRRPDWVGFKANLPKGSIWISQGTDDTPAWIDGKQTFSYLADYGIARNFDGQNFTNIIFGEQILSSEGTPKPPSPGFSHFQLQRFSNTPFELRKKRGEICVKPYSHQKTSVTTLNGWQTVGVVDTRTQDLEPFFNHTQWNTFDTFNSKEVSKWSKIVNRNGTPEIKIPGLSYFSFPNRGAVAVKDILVKDVTAAEVGFDFSAFKTFLFDLHKPECDDAVMVQKVLAKANQKDIDALTSIAELPMTIHSILNGMNTIVRIVKDARKREVHWTSRIDSISLEKARNAYQKERRDRNSNRRNPRPLESFDVWYARRKNFYIRNATREIGDALAQIWLTARYEIIPSVAMVEEAANAIKHLLEVEYRTSKDRVIKDLDFSKFETDGWKWVGVATTTHRCHIKRKFGLALDFPTALNQVVQSDLLVTAWELVPLWSIIADWFFTIGDFLGAITWNPQHEEEQASYSVKTEVVGKFVHESGAVVSVSHKWYDRKLIRPSAYLGIHLDVDFNTLRQIDSIFFIWTKARGDVNELIKNLSR